MVWVLSCASDGATVYGHDDGMNSAASATIFRLLHAFTFTQSPTGLDVTWTVIGLPNDDARGSVLDQCVANVPGNATQSLSLAF